MTNSRNQKNPLLSICIPTYNRADKLKALLDSIEQQEEGKEVEIVISDNNSTDNTNQIVSDYQKKYNNIRYFKNKRNLGFDFNILQSLKMANGNFCWTIGDDDLLEKNAILKLKKILKKNPQCAYFLVNHKIIFGSKQFNCISLENDIYFKTGQKFFKHRCKDYWKIGILGAFSISIFAGIYNKNFLKKSLLQKLLKEYNNTFLIHLALIFNIINNNPVYFIHTPMTISIPDTRFPKNITKKDVYFKHLPKILNDAKKLNFSKISIEKMKYYNKIRSWLVELKHFLFKK